MAMSKIKQEIFNRNMEHVLKMITTAETQEDAARRIAKYYTEQISSIIRKERTKSNQRTQKSCPIRSGGNNYYEKDYKR